MGFHLHIVLTPLRCNSRIEGDAHRHRIRQRDTVFSGLLLVRLSRTAVALDGKPGKATTEAFNERNIALIEDGFSAGELPTYQFQRKATEHHDPGSLGIDPDVVLSSRRHVSFTARSASHEHTATDLGRDSWLLSQSEGKIGERSQRDDCQPGVRVDRFDHGVDGRQRSARLTRRRIIVISKSVTAMKPGRALVCTKQWLFSPSIDWDIRSTKFNRIERVTRGLLNVDISGNCGDCHNAHFGSAESHDESDSVIRSNVGIDQEGTQHTLG